MGHFTKGSSAYWTYKNIFIPLYLLRKRTCFFPCLVSFYLNFCDHFFLTKKTFLFVCFHKKILTICSLTGGFYFKDNGIFTSCFVWGSVGCKGWEKKSPQLPQPNKTPENDDCIHFHPTPHLESDLSERRAANSCCFSQLHRFPTRRWLSRADAAPSLAPACLWAVKDISLPTIKRASYKSREALFLISWNEQNAQLKVKMIARPGNGNSECASPVAPGLGDAPRGYSWTGVGLSTRGKMRCGL